MLTIHEIANSYGPAISHGPAISYGPANSYGMANLPVSHNS